jgi:putative SOS response-associated peptidase YedK
MCGRFYDIHDLDDITNRFRVDRPRDLSLPFRYNVAPSQSVPVIRVQDDERELVLMRWGLIPHWAKDEKIGYRMINARAETVREKPSYRDAFASRRLVVPVSGETSLPKVRAIDGFRERSIPVGHTRASAQD